MYLGWINTSSPKGITEYKKIHTQVKGVYIFPVYPAVDILQQWWFKWGRDITD